MDESRQLFAIGARLAEQQQRRAIGRKTRQFAAQLRDRPAAADRRQDAGRAGIDEFAARPSRLGIECALDGA